MQLRFAFFLQEPSQWLIALPSGIHAITTCMTEPCNECKQHGKLTIYAITIVDYHKFVCLAQILLWLQVTKGVRVFSMILQWKTMVQMRGIVYCKKQSLQQHAFTMCSTHVQKGNGDKAIMAYYIYASSTVAYGLNELISIDVSGICVIHSTR